MTKPRREERKKEANRVIVEELQGDQIPSGKKVHFALTDDISFRGIKILSETCFPVDSLLKVRLFLGAINKEIDMMGKVRWVNSLDDEMYEVGVEIDTANTSRDDMQILIDHLYRWP